MNSALRRLACSLKGLRSFQLSILCLLLASLTLPSITANAEGDAVYPEGDYVDDTHKILESDVDIEIVSGNFGFAPYFYNQPPDSEWKALDARDAVFTLANSKNSNPTVNADCETGSLQTNRYPFKVYNADNSWVVGGIIRGEIPQESDWKPTYCNSAGVIFKDAPDGGVDGIRVTAAWDGFRAAGGSSGLTIKNSWISNIRDDAVENDNFLPLIFEDNLVDGSFQGISIHSGGEVTVQSKARIQVYGNVIRIREYLFKGRQQYGALFKNEESSPTSEIHNTVLAVDYKGGRTFKRYWERSWSKIEDCSNNLFLWLSDEPIPSTLPLPPACFEVIKGPEAVAEWARAKQNWINCHPRVARMTGEPTSDHQQCVINTFGGYSK